MWFRFISSWVCFHFFSIFLGEGAIILIGLSPIFLELWALSKIEAPSWTPIVKLKTNVLCRGPPFQFKYIWELNFKQTIWDKSEVLLGMSWGTYWEHIGNKHKTKIHSPFPPPPPSPQKKKIGPLMSACVPFHWLHETFISKTMGHSRHYISQNVHPLRKQNSMQKGSHQLHYKDPPGALHPPTWAVGEPAPTLLNALLPFCIYWDVLPCHQLFVVPTLDLGLIWEIGNSGFFFGPVPNLFPWHSQGVPQVLTQDVPNITWAKGGGTQSFHRIFYFGEPP